MFPETELLMKLMNHLVIEKIEYATVNVWNENAPDPTKDEYIAEDPIPIPASMGSQQNSIQESKRFQEMKSAQYNQSIRSKSVQNSNLMTNREVNMHKPTVIRSENESRIQSSRNSNSEFCRLNDKSGNSTGKKMDGNCNIEVIGKIKINRPKAVLISLNEYGELWIPKSAIAN